MATASISGLTSGLDTATIISQLMQVEAISQNRLKSQVTTAQSTVKSLQDLNTKLAGLATSAEKLAKTTGWNPVTVSSTSDLVTATGTTTATTGTTTFTVGALATAHSLSFTAPAAMADVVTTGSTSVRLDLLDGNGPRDLDTGDGTLAGLVIAVNKSGAGVQASTVKLDDGTYRLRVGSSTTGESSDFTLTNLDGSTLLGGATVTPGQDAAITVGADVLHSASNTFSGVVNGLDITLRPGLTTGTVVDLSTTQDAPSLGASVKSLVDAINSALGDIDKLSAYNSTTKTKGPLAGDSASRTVRDRLFGTVNSGDGTSLASLGIQTDRYGKLTFDQAAFEKAFTADPVVTAAAFTSTAGGFAARVQDVAKGASDSIDGTLTQAIKGRTTDITQIQDRIDDWDTRLELRQATLTRQFTALETALNRLNSQSSWLSGQLSALGSS